MTRLVGQGDLPPLTPLNPVNYTYNGATCGVYRFLDWEPLRALILALIIALIGIGPASPEATASTTSQLQEATGGELIAQRKKKRRKKHRKRREKRKKRKK